MPCQNTTGHTQVAPRWMEGIAHYFIRKDGSIYGIQKKIKAAALGNEKNKIEICLEGCYTIMSNGKVLTEKVVPQAQLDALIWLVNDIKKRWTIEAVKRHADYPSAKKEGKDCPGKYFPWSRFIESLEDRNLFNDIHGHYAEKYIKAVAEAGLMVGDGKGNFGPDTPLTRAQLAIVLCRALELPVE